MKRLLTSKEPFGFITNSMYLVLVFKILVKYKKINVKTFTSKTAVESITFRIVFGTYYLVARLFLNQGSKNVLHCSVISVYG